jgi:hypothetical protein
LVQLCCQLNDPGFYPGGEGTFLFSVPQAAITVDAFIRDKGHRYKRLTSELHLMLKLRKSRAKFLLPLCALMAVQVQCNLQIFVDMGLVQADVISVAFCTEFVTGISELSGSATYIICHNHAHMHYLIKLFSNNFPFFTVCQHSAVCFRGSQILLFAVPIDI